MAKNILCVLFLCVTCSASSVDPVSNAKRIVALENSVRTLQTQSKSSEQKYAALISNILNKLTANSNEIPRLKSDFNLLQQEHNHTLHELDWTREQLRTLALQYSDLKVKYDSMSSEIIVITSQLDTAAENNTDLRKSVSSIQALITTLPNVTNAGLLVDTQALLRKHTSRIKVLEIEANQTKLTLKSMKSDIVTDAADIKKMRADLTRQESQGTNFQTRLSVLQSSVINHTKQIAEATNKGQQCLTKLGTVETDVNHGFSGYTQQIASLNVKVAANGQTVASLLKYQVKNMQRLFFQEFLSNNQMFLNNVPLVFAGPKTVYGQTVADNNGRYTLPVTGIYIFWINIPPDTGRTIVEIVKQGGVIASGTAGTAPILAVTIAQKNDQIWFTKKSSDVAWFQGSYKSHLGGVLVHAL